MSTSQRAPLRCVKRPGQRPTADLQAQQSPIVNDTDTSYPTHSLGLVTDKPLDSVQLPSRSATISLTQLQTPSKTAKATALTEASLLSSPHMPPSNTPKSPAATPACSTNGGSGDAVVNRQRVEPSGNSEDGVSSVVCASPEKTAAKRLLGDNSSGSPTSQTHAGGDGKVAEESSQLRPIEESFSFEFYSNHKPNNSRNSAGNHNHHHSRPANAAAAAADPRIPRGMLSNPYRESPMAPNTLPMMAIPDGLSQHYLMSASSRDQQLDGRYAAMSQSSRFEDANQLTPRPTDGEESLVESSTQHRVPQLDDIVCHSTTESFLADDAGGSNVQPLRVDTSMNSQNFIRNYKRRQAARNAGGGEGGKGGAGNGRYNSTSVSISPRMSADVAAPNSHVAAPELFSSDQLTYMPTAHGGKRHGGKKAAGGAAAAESGDAPFDRQDANVPGTPSTEAFLTAIGGTAADGDNGSSASPSSADDFSMVRAPVSGLRAKVLGNTAVDEDEAAEDPEARKMLAQQIQSFVFKVVKQHHEEKGDGSPSAEAAAESDARAQILRRANAEAAEANQRHNGLEPCCPTPTTLPDEPSNGSNGDGDKPTAAEVVNPLKTTKSNKHVRFNLEGLSPRDEGPNALRMPRHSVTKCDGEADKRPVSPPVLELGSDVGGDGSEEELRRDTADSSPTKRNTSPRTVDVRSLLRAGVVVQDLLSPSSSAVEEAAASADSVEVVAWKNAIPPMQACYAAALSSASLSVGTQVQPPRCTRESTVADDDQPLHTPLTPESAFSPMAVLPPTMMASPMKSVPVPPAPTSVTQLSSSAQEPKKRRKSAEKIRKAAKMHRKAAVALVAGAGEPVTVAHSSNSSMRHSQLAPLDQTSGGSLRGSTEVGMPESSQLQHPLQASLSSPNLRVLGNEAGASTHRVHITEVKRQSCATPPAASPPLRAMQVVAPRQSTAVPLVMAIAAAAAAAEAAAAKGEDAKAVSPARRGSAGTTAAAPLATGSATTPSSRRSSLSLAGGPTLKTATFTELPPLSASSRSRTSTPDIGVPTSVGNNTSTGATATTTTAVATVSREADTSGVASLEGLRQGRSCGIVEYKGERGISPSSRGSSDKSFKLEPPLSENASGKVQAMQSSTHVLPRLSGSSLKPHASSHTMTPPPA